MEFFREVHSPGQDAADLKALITINRLTDLCASISSVTPRREHEADIFCLWGSFSVRREEIRFGVRFSLLDCPHALAWTITFNEENGSIVIHCTIDKTEQDQDFVDSIHEFVADWSAGIVKSLRQDYAGRQILNEVKI